MMLNSIDFSFLFLSGPWATCIPQNAMQTQGKLFESLRGMLSILAALLAHVHVSTGKRLAQSV